MTSSDTTFSAGLPHAVHPALAPALAARGYEKLTAVQLAVLGEELADADLLVSAQTGSGKTVAFGLAIASSLLAGGDRFGRAERPLGLIIAPTRELALQVQRELDWLYAESGVVTASCVGGMDARTERRALERGAHIVVGTPGRLRDHITRGALDLSDIQAVVLDEADEMLDLGFREDLEFILAAAPEDRRTLLFSATVPRAIAELAKTFQRDAVRITATAATERHADIEYQMVLTQSGERESAIINTLLFFDSSSSIVFCHTREAVKQLTTRLAGRGFPVVALSGELTQSERTHALEAMRDGRARVCVATDVAARGIDLPNLDLVVHAELPTKPDTLLHRSGRTGRAGRKGVCVLIVPQHRRSAALRVFKLANIEAITRSAPSMAEIEARNRQQILEVAAASPGPDADEAPMVAELLARVSPEQLAAAYLRQQVSARPAPETISAVAISAVSEKPRRHEKGSWEPVGEGSERPPRAPDMVGGVWFTLSLGRKHRADPKWLLPMICKAGGVTKREVGSIKILDTETRFEIAADRAEAFAGLVARNGSGEKGVNIAPADGRAAPQPRVPPVRRDEPPREHARPGAVEKSAAEPATPPRPRKQPKNTKDKGKPKYKTKRQLEDVGQATRTRPPKPARASRLPE